MGVSTPEHKHCQDFADLMHEGKEVAGCDIPFGMSTHLTFGHINITSSENKNFL